MDADTLALLRSVDTPTVCNAIEVAQGRRGFAGFTRGTMLCSAPDAPAVVGYAATATIAAASPPDEQPDVVRSRRMEYYRMMAEAPRPAVAMLEDLDFPDCVGAYWGEINTNVHKGLGLSGAVTNGVMRDLGDLPDGFPVVAGSVGPSHAHVHVRELGVPVTVFGLTVRPGDLIHADRHGALVIPESVIPNLPGALARLHETERIVLDASQSPGFDFTALEAAWSRFEKART